MTVKERMIATIDNAYNKILETDKSIKLQRSINDNERFYFIKTKLNNGLSIYLFANCDAVEYKIQLELNTGKDTSLNKKIESIVTTGNAIANKNENEYLRTLSIKNGSELVVFQAPRGSTTPVGTEFGKCIQLAKFNNKRGSPSQELKDPVEAFFAMIKVTDIVDEFISKK